VAGAETALEEIGTLLTKGARPWQPITGRFGHFLQLAAHYGRQDLITLLAKFDLRVDAVGKMLPLTSLQFVV